MKLSNEPVEITMHCLQKIEVYEAFYLNYLKYS
jgi:hypothetical protein